MKKICTILIAVLVFNLIGFSYRVEATDPIIEENTNTETNTTVDPEPEPDLTPDPEPELTPEPEPELTPEPELDPEPIPEPETTPEPEPITPSYNNTHTNIEPEEEEEEPTETEKKLEEMKNAMLNNQDIEFLSITNYNSDSIKANVSTKTLTESEKEYLNNLTPEELEELKVQINQILETVKFEPTEKALNSFKKNIDSEEKYISLNFTGNINLNFPIDVIIEIAYDETIDISKTYYIYHYDENADEIVILGIAEIKKLDNENLQVKFSTKSFSDFFITDKNIDDKKEEVQLLQEKTEITNVKVKSGTPKLLLGVLLIALIGVVITLVSIIKKRNRPV